MPQVIAFAAAFPHAGKDRVAAVKLRHVVNEFLNHHGLAHAGTSEDAGLAALGEGGNQVYHLEAGFKDLRLGGALGKRGRLA